MAADLDLLPSAARRDTNEAQGYLQGGRVGQVEGITDLGEAWRRGCW